MDNGEEKEKLKDIYFIIFMDTKKKILPEEIKLENHENISCIFSSETKIEDKNEPKFNYQYVFKQGIKNDKKRKDIKIKFKIQNDDEYKITFTIKDKSAFVFDLNLIEYNGFFKRDREIKQDKEYFDKIKIFIKALEQSNEESKIPILYNDAINLYFENPKFPLLIKLFTHIYENKDLCSLLLFKFNSTKDKSNQINSIIEKDLDFFKENISSICEEAENLVQNFGYDPIQFYGLILIYLNNYDYDKFSSLLNRLYEKSKEILFEILIIYKPYIKNELKCDLNFYDDFIIYSNSKTYDVFINNCIAYLKDINIFLNVLEHHKAKIINIKKFIPIKVIDIDKNSKLDINIIKDLIEKIIYFSEEENKLLIFFIYQFWENIVNNYSTAIPENITIYYNFRVLFERYYKLVTKIYEQKESKIKEDATLFHNNEFYSRSLDKMVLKYIENSDIDNKDIISLINGYDIYYGDNKEDEDKYKNRRTIDIFNKINFETVDQEFIDKFKKCNFEIKFKNQIDKYLLKFFSKVKNIEHLSIIIKLINIENLSKKKDTYLTLLKDNYDSLIINEFSQAKQIDEKKYENIIDSIAFLTNFLYIHEQNFDFLSLKIGKLDKKIAYKIYIKLIDEKELHEKMIEYIKNLYLKQLNIENIPYFLEFIKKLKMLKNDEYNSLINKIADSYLLEPDDFYLFGNNIKIELLKILIDNKIIEENDYYYKETSRILTSAVYKQIEEKNIEIKNLNSFFKNDENTILERLNILNKFNVKERVDPKEIVQNLKKIKDQIDNTLNELNFIIDSLLKYHDSIFKKEISEIKDIMAKINYGTNREYDQNEIKIKNFTKKFKAIASDVNKVYNSKIFGAFYKIQKKKGLKQDAKFAKALNLYKSFLESLNKNKDKDKDISKIFTILKDEIDIKDSHEISAINIELNNIMKQDKKCNENLEDNEFFIVLNIKVYEEYVNSIFFFFSNFKKNDKEWDKYLSKKYMNLSENNIDILKIYLKELKEKGIYDFKSKLNERNYLVMFKCLYEKNQVYDFLMTKSFESIDLLIDRIEGSTLTIKDIKDTSDCIGFFLELKKKKDNFEIFNYVKENMKDEILNKFINFSSKFISIIELYQNCDSSKNVFKNIKDIISTGKFIFHQDNEEFSYFENGEEKIIKIEDLKILNNKIHIRTNISKLENKNNELIFFKNLVKNLDVINKYMVKLRKKGSCLPINISIKNNYIDDQNFKVTYLLEGEEKEFKMIKEYLSKVLNDLRKRIDSIYKKLRPMRFIYGKQIVSLNKYLIGHIDIEPFLRYILNETNNKNKINRGEKNIERRTEKYVELYDIYNQDTFNNISNYILNLLKCNGSSLEKHYKNILIKSNESNKLKGIYLYKSQSNSMEEDILQIFLEHTRNIPIAQNILVTNKETSLEEMQAFFNRSILCDFNTLFVVQLNTSFSEYQQKIMNDFIDKLLIYKNIDYNDKYQESIGKNQTEVYMDSCIIFIYNKNYNKSFLNEIKKLEPQIYPTIETRFSLNLNDSFSLDIETLNSIRLLYDNTHVIESEFCGLGKSTKIKSEILKSNEDEKKNNKKKKYVYFPLGGNITKDIIYNKLNKILKGIKTDDDYNDIAIHLDLYENNEPSIVNEFLFSFLITKFYSNNENIIYIPKNIEIYIEIPNCFYDFKANYEILNSFKWEKIELKDLPILKLSTKKFEHFKNMLGKNSLEEISKYIYEKMEKMGNKKYSYHQIKIFINLFICQYGKFDSKLIFKENGKDITEDCIEDFSKGTKYFISGGFSKNLIEDAQSSVLKIKEEDKKKYINSLSEIYDKDIKDEKFETPLIFIYTKMKEENGKKEKNHYATKLDISEKGLEKYETSKDFLKELKYFLNLNNPVESSKKVNYKNRKSLMEIIDEDKYVITRDNFKKMVLILYRIIAKIPVILMGETGCGKTSLIKKLNQLLNNGKEVLETINIHPGITDEFLIKKMNKINEKANENPKEELWVFFDELNTCNSLALLTEIFINRSFSGKKLEKNIRIMGACNPYRKRKENQKICGLTYPNDENELIYTVNILPQSLMYYVFNFSSINPTDEKKYISSIISEIFSEDDEEKILQKKTTEVISNCHEYLRNKFDISTVSLREMKRFKICCKFFTEEYFPKKNKYLNLKENKIIEKLKSIIISIYICYYIRLIDKQLRSDFEDKIRNSLLELVNYKSSEKLEGENLLDKISNPLHDELKKIPTEIKNFSFFIEFEEQFLIKEIDLGDGIGSNKMLRENLFLLFISLNTNIPLIIIGKPGSGKSLSAQLICKAMKGNNSTSKFFQLFPYIIQSYFQGAFSTTPEEVEGIFEVAEKILESFIENNEKNLPISMILFDELGLADKSKYNPLKVLHSKLDQNPINDNKNKNIQLKKPTVSFVGISNYIIDAAKINRAFSLSVPDLDQSLDDLIEASKSIVESIEPNSKNDEIFTNLLPRVYNEYKIFLNQLKNLDVYSLYELEEFNDKIKNQIEDIDFKSLFPSKSKEEKISFDELKNKKNQINKILRKKNIDPSWFTNTLPSDDEYRLIYKKYKKLNVDFHGNRDFYYLIKGIANEFKSFDSYQNIESKKKIIEKYISRNFGGLEIKIDIDLSLEFHNTQDFIEFVKGLKNKGDEIIKINSELLFKKIYNNICDKNSMVQYSIENINNQNNDFLNNIIDNINDQKSRFILIQIKPSLGKLIYQSIKSSFKNENTKFYEGSPFPDDNGSEYRYKMINIILENLEKEGLIVLQNLSQLYPFLYDLFNMNYTIKDDKKYARIYQGNFNDQLVAVNDMFRVIIEVDKKYVNNIDPPFLNRFEKTIISFDKLLDKEQKDLSDRIYNNNLNFKVYISQKSKEYNAKYLFNLIIGSDIQDIQAFIYYYFSKKTIKNKMTNNEIEVDENNIESEILIKVAKLLPQDIIANLPIDTKIIEKYKDINKTNLNDYLKANKTYKIYIIYTFSIISTSINEIDESSNFIIISGIKSEEELKNTIDEIINRLKNEGFDKKQLIFLHFEQQNSKKLSFVVDFLTNNYENEKIKFLLIVHVKRNLNDDTNENIYSVLNVYDYVDQVFLDNLSGKISLNKILSSPIKDIVNKNFEDLEVKKIFYKALNQFLNKYLKILSENNDSENYIKNIIDYFNNSDFYKSILEKAKSFIEGKGNNLIDKIYNEKYIDENTTDIASIMLDYIKEGILGQNLENIFAYLEDQNILTSLVNVNKIKFIEKDLLLEIMNNCLKNINLKKQFNPKFNLNLYVPGFYFFYIELSKYIESNISFYFKRNEKKLRKLKKNFEESKEKYHKKELELVNTLYQEVQTKEFIFEKLNDMPLELMQFILNDYISFFIQKQNENISLSDLPNEDVYHNIINLILDLRFNDNIKIMMNISKEPIKKLLLKIIWIESNSKYLMQIIKVYTILKDIFSSKDELFSLIKDIVSSKSIKYFENGIITTSHNKEVNECYYIILGAICSSIMPDKINNKILEEEENNNYFDKLKNSLKIIDILNNDLLLYLNEMYMIDELIQIYNVLLLNDKLKIEIIKEFSKNLRKSNQILQSNSEDKSIELTKTINDLYDLVKKYLNCNDNNYYTLLNYIFYKEIKKVEDIDYHISIFENIINENELIAKSNDILQILLESIVNTSKGKFQNAKNKLLGEKNQFLALLEKNLQSNSCQNTLMETLLYFFEKKSLIYLNNILNMKNNKKEEIHLDDGDDEKKVDNKIKDKENKKEIDKKKENEELPFTIFKDCITFLKDLHNHPNAFEKNNKNITKLFSISYIKAFCFKFISLINQNSSKLKNPLKIIEAINGSKIMRKMISLYIFKIIYYQNKKKIDIFINPHYIQKYLLDQYTYFKDLIIHTEENPFTYKYINSTLEENSINNYENYFKILQEYKNQKFCDVDINKISIEDFGLDIFYFSSYNIILSCLKFKDFSNSDLYTNFFKNICIPLFKNNNNLFTAIQFFYDSQKFEKIKIGFEISLEDIEKLLYSYRYCLNELNSNNKNSIFGFLYDKRNIDKNIEKIKDYYFPGNDVKKDIKIYKLYSNITNHFLTKKSNYGCFVCLCENGFYHSVYGGYPKEKSLNMKCEGCKKPIGSIRQHNSRYLTMPVKRENYFRIFKDKDELDKAVGKKNYNYMTFDDFKENYIKDYLIEDKGITKVDEEHLKKDNKIIRNLSQVSYRLLNYILFSHLFFARLYTENRKLDDFLPENMSWIGVINECWELLKVELEKKEVISIEIFLNYIFSDLFKEINKENKIDDYKKFIDFETKLDNLIEKTIKDFNLKYKSLKATDKNNKFLYENLLEEVTEDIKDSEYPYYYNFIYSDYINEEYLIENLKHKSGNKYPVLSTYLEYYNSKKEEGKKLYQLKKLKNYNDVLNLFYDNYSNNLIRKKAEQTILNEEKFYSENKDNIDKFIKYYNSLNKKDEKNNIIKLRNNCYLSNFFLDDMDTIGKTYKEIYYKFIEEQNNQIIKLLDIKIKEGIFDSSCKNEINIQNVNDDEIFLLDLPEKFSFIDVVFNSSYRKVIFNGDYKSYNQFSIDYDLIEERMTDILLRNKKLFNNDIKNFIYDNENLIFENTNILTIFKQKMSKELSIKDKIILYTYYNDHKNGENLLKKLLEDFRALIIFYNNNLICQNDQKNNIYNNLTWDSTIYDSYKYISNNDIISKYFKDIFNDKSNITINKIVSAFEFYLVLIFEDLILKEIEKNQIEGEKLPKEKIDEFLKKLKNNYNITKEEFTNAIRLFISLFLYEEKDKVNKIKNNYNNISFYLNYPDLWDSRVFNNKEAFKKVLSDIKELNVPINQIISLYIMMEENIEKKYISEVKEQIERDKLAAMNKEKIKISNLEPPETAGVDKIDLNKINESNKTNGTEMRKEENKNDEDDKGDDSSFDEEKYYNKKDSEDDSNDDDD